MVFNVMARNCDDHTKNFSFLMKQGGEWERTPAYDVTFAHNPKGEWTYQHLMSMNGKFSGIKEEDVLSIADRFGIGTAPKVIDAVKEAVKAWPEFAQAAEISQMEISRIASYHLMLE
jgi:serine/threonine-protein kinase HipA